MHDGLVDGAQLAAGFSGPCLDCKYLQSGYCSTFRLYLTNFPNRLLVSVYLSTFTTTPFVSNPDSPKTCFTHLQHCDLVGHLHFWATGEDAQNFHRQFPATKSRISVLYSIICLYRQCTTATRTDYTSPVCGMPVFVYIHSLASAKKIHNALVKFPE